MGRAYSGQIYNFVGIHPSPENNNLLVHQGKWLSYFRTSDLLPDPTSRAGFKTQLIQQFSHFDSKLVEIMKYSSPISLHCGVSDIRG